MGLVIASQTRLRFHYLSKASLGPVGSYNNIPRILSSAIIPSARDSHLSVTAAFQVWILLSMSRLDCLSNLLLTIFDLLLDVLRFVRVSLGPRRGCHLAP
jgi:hypothetical protein